MGNRGGAPPLLAWTRRVMDLATKLMQLILSALRNTDRPIPVYVWHAWLIVLIPDILIAAIVVAALFGTGLSTETHSLLPSLMTLTFFGELVVKAPWTETLIMWPILFTLRLILGNTIWVPVASGLIWGNLHAFGGEQSGVSQIWGFFVLSVCFLEWEKKSKGLAILVTGLVHMLGNLVPFLLLFLLWIFFY
jgi:hypothetical protein